ncbi:PAS domain-containing sensor histidine kinase [Fulvivirga sp. 29W222]|uniref:histidine kinase n=1 Tax=Fulvivirga marina TaxID=2494733 RepID=A0A937KBR3_9BACT|nr:PAS domain-containing sensor histidine kinase [Fulvivirga marina]MBL6447271.1 PAS domain-containing sensor histidine kinase [Fulvivirga marina]
MGQKKNIPIIALIVLISIAILIVLFYNQSYGRAGTPTLTSSIYVLAIALFIALWTAINPSSSEKRKPRPKKNNEIADVEKRYKKIIEEAPHAIAMFDKNMKYMVASHQWMKDYDIKQSDLTGVSHYDIFPEIGDEWKKIHQECLKGAINTCDEASFKRADGTVQWITWDVRPWYISGNTIGGLIMYTSDITDIKEKEFGRKRVENTLDKASKVARIGTWEIDLDTGYILWNSVTQQILEVPENFKADYAYIFKFFKKGKNRADIETAVAEAINLGKAYDLELELVTDKGNTLWARVIGQPEFINGRCQRLYGVFQDINEAKKNEQIIQEERKLLRAIIDNIPLNVYTKDLQSRKTLVNKSECDYLGLKEEDILGKDDFELFAIDSAIQSVKEDQYVYSTGKSLKNMECRHVKSDNTETWFMFSKVPLRDKTGKINGLLGISYDITSRKVTENQIKTLLANLKTIMDATTEVSIISTDLNGKIKHFNKGAENLLGYRAEEVVMKKTPVIFHDKNEISQREKELSNLLNKKIKGYDALTEYAKQGQSESREWTFIKKDGSKIKVQLAVTAIKNETNTITGFLGIATDITERVENQKKLFEAKTSLEVLTERLTEQNAQLANFAHITSHNLRSPVSNLSSLLHLYNLAESKQEKELIFEKFKIVIQHLSSTLNTLIETLKNEEANSKETEIIDFQEVLNKTLDIITAQITESKAVITCDFSAAPVINYNRNYLESIFLNLLTNSIKYRAHNIPPQIHVKTDVTEKGITLTITDNGLGIDLDKHGNKLFKLNKTFHDNPEAKGVGLYITKSHVESMGGSISVASQVGKGSTFKVNF